MEMRRYAVMAWRVLKYLVTMEVKKNEIIWKWQLTNDSTPDCVSSPEGNNKNEMASMMSIT